MEAYYKARRKKLTQYQRQIKKLYKSGEKDQIKELRKQYMALWLETPPARSKFMSESAYLKEMKRTIREIEEPFLTLKLDLCYDLAMGMEDYDAYEEKTNMLRKTQGNLLTQKREREHQSMEEKKRAQEKYNGMVASFQFTDESDQPALYRDIETLSEQMSNPRRKVIAYEIEHKELEYRLTQMYDPWVEVQIT